MNTLDKTVVEYELKLSNLERNLEDVRRQLDKMKSDINECRQEKDFKERYGITRCQLFLYLSGLFIITQIIEKLRRNSGKYKLIRKA